MAEIFIFPNEELESERKQNARFRLKGHSAEIVAFPGVDINHLFKPEPVKRKIRGPGWRVDSRTKLER